MRDIVWVPEPRGGPLPLSARLWELHCLARPKWPWPITLNVEPLSKLEASSPKHAGTVPGFGFPIRITDRSAAPPLVSVVTAAVKGVQWAVYTWSKIWVILYYNHFCKAQTFQTVSYRSHCALCHKETVLPLANKTFPAQLHPPFLFPVLYCITSSWQVAREGDKEQTFPGILRDFIKEQEIQCGEREVWEYDP